MSRLFWTFEHSTVAALALATTGALIGCATINTPASFSELETVSQSPASKQAATLAPATVAAAERARAEASRAMSDGDDRTADVDAERALALYALADAQARDAVASGRARDAVAARDDAQHALADTLVARARADAEAAELDAELRVASHPVNVRTSSPAAHEREVARLASARSLAVEGRALCLSAGMVASSRGASAGNDATLDDEARAVNDAITTTKDKAGPAVDAAARYRAHCLASLTSARVASAQAAPASSAATADGGVAPRDPDSSTEADALLTRLSTEAGLSPRRNEMGVVVTLATPFDGNALRESARATVDHLAAIAAERHLPMLFVVHDAAVKDAESDAGKNDARGVAAIGVAKSNGRSVVASSLDAKNRLNVVDPSDAAHRSENERLDVILVTR